METVVAGNKSPSWSVFQMNSKKLDRSASVLLVEDSEIWRETIGEKLGSMGFDVTMAESLPKARLELERRSFDLLILDPWLAGTLGTGINTAEGLAILDELKARAANLPTIVLSATENVQEVAEYYLIYRINAFIPKNPWRSYADLFGEQVLLAVNEDPGGYISLSQSRVSSTRRAGYIAGWTGVIMGGIGMMYSIYFAALNNVGLSPLFLGALAIMLIAAGLIQRVQFESILGRGISIESKSDETDGHFREDLDGD